jgi:ribosomal protein S12 methylthiotransferase accessory factor
MTDRRPQFKRCFRYEIVPSEGVFLLSEQGYFLLSGATYIHLAPYLDGRYTETELVKLLNGQVSAPELFYALERLRRRGYIVDAAPSMPPAQAAFWDMLEVDPTIATRRLQESTVSITSFGRVESAPLQSSLEELGIHVIKNGKRRIVVTDDYLQNGLDAFNQEMLEHNRPWMLVKPVGAEIWIGPVFIPGQTGCWACLAHRLQGHRKVESYLKAKMDTPGPFPTSLSATPSTLQVASGLAATEIAKWIGCDNTTLTGKIVTLNTLTLEKNEHVLTQRPQCPTCGSPDMFTAAQSAPPKLQSRKKSFTIDGGHRIASPGETFKQFEHHISPITGIVSDLQEVSVKRDKTGLTRSYVADHNFVQMNDDRYFMRENLRGRAGGKGKLDDQAKAGALCESIERYSGVFQGDEARIRAKLKDLDTAIHPNDCMRFSQQQFENREEWNKKDSWFNWVPEPFDEEMDIEWSPVWSLTCNESRYVPTAYCYYGYSQKYNAWFARADANGCATGNSREEAILQGFMELVERDCVALWWYNRLKKPAVDLSGFGDPYFQQLQEFYLTLQRDLWVLDITSDLNIPAFAAISRRNDQEIEDIMFGFGAHFDPHIAILRALTELNQLLPAVSSEKSKRLSPDREDIHWWQTATIENQPYLAPDETLPQMTESDYPRNWSDDLYTDVMSCVQIAQAKGLETLVLDQTRPDIGLHVVKVIVPGMRHFWARFGPGRLYDVPVQMGWLDAPLPEDRLNPYYMFL